MQNTLYGKELDGYLTSKWNLPIVKSSVDGVKRRNFKNQYPRKLATKIVVRKLSEMNVSSDDKRL